MKAKIAGRECPDVIEERRRTYQRSEEVASYAKAAAEGKCVVCDEPVPQDLDPMQFLDCHHIIFLRDSGPDTRENVVGVCPNCHRRLHVSPDDQLVGRLLRTAKERAAELDRQD